jgi:hypothetical protein
MYFTELVWHNILEFRYGKRPFGFWKWKSHIHKSLTYIKSKKQYYSSSTTKYVYGENGMLDFCIFKIQVYDFWDVNYMKHIFPTQNLFIDKKHRNEFSKTLRFR